MRRVLMLAVLLTMALTMAACGGSESQRSEEAPPEQGQTAPATQGADTEGAPVQSSKEERAQGAEGGEAAGLSVTTLEGEQVAVGGQGDVTALYFMAGW